MSFTRKSWAARTVKGGEGMEAAVHIYTREENMTGAIKNDEGRKGGTL